MSDNQSAPAHWSDCPTTMTTTVYDSKSKTWSNPMVIQFANDVELAKHITNHTDLRMRAVFYGLFEHGVYEVQYFNQGDHDKRITIK
jgi:hypothetical protein